MLNWDKAEFFKMLFWRQFLPHGTWSNQPHTEIYISSDTQLKITLPLSCPTLTLKNLAVQKCFHMLQVSFPILAEIKKNGAE